MKISQPENTQQALKIEQPTQRIQNEIRIRYNKSTIWPKPEPIPEKTVYYPFEDLYPTIDIQKILNHPPGTVILDHAEGDERIFNAVYWLQTNRLKDLLSNQPELAGKSFKEEIRKMNFNLIEWLCMERGGFGSYTYQHNKQAYLDIAECLLKAAKECILTTPQAFESARYYKMNELITLMNQYAVEDDTVGVCRYCSSTEPRDTLVHPCKCTSPVHVECLGIWFKKRDNQKSLCEICHDPFSKMRIKRDQCGSPHDRLFFPFDNLYPHPAFSQQPLVRVKSKSDIIGYAVIYLQTHRIRDLIQKCTSQDDLRELVNMRWGAYNQTPLNLLCTGNVCTNYHCTSNLEAYLEITKLFLDTKVADLTLVDEFGRTPLQNAEYYQFGEIINLLK